MPWYATIWKGADQLIGPKTNQDETNQRHKETPLVKAETDITKQAQVLPNRIYTAELHLTSSRVTLPNVPHASAPLPVSGAIHARLNFIQTSNPTRLPLLLARERTFGASTTVRYRFL